MSRGARSTPLLDSTVQSLQPFLFTILSYTHSFISKYLPSPQTRQIPPTAALHSASPGSEKDLSSCTVFSRNPYFARLFFLPPSKPAMSKSSTESFFVATFFRGTGPLLGAASGGWPSFAFLAATLACKAAASFRFRFRTSPLCMNQRYRQ